MTTFIQRPLLLPEASLVRPSLRAGAGSRLEEATLSLFEHRPKRACAPIGVRNSLYTCRHILSRDSGRKSHARSRLEPIASAGSALIAAGQPSARKLES